MVGLTYRGVSKPGLIMKAYSAFHHYSTGNQLPALSQDADCSPARSTPFQKWKELGRYVKRGERALSLCMPITLNEAPRKHAETDTERDQTHTSFIYKARWFVVSQTDGKELESTPIPYWNAGRAVANWLTET